MSVNNDKEEVVEIEEFNKRETKTSKATTTLGNHRGSAVALESDSYGDDYFGGVPGSGWDAILRILPVNQHLPVVSAIQATNRFLSARVDEELLGLPHDPLPYTPSPTTMLNAYDSLNKRGVKCCFVGRRECAHQYHFSSHHQTQNTTNITEATTATGGGGTSSTTTATPRDGGDGVIILRPIIKWKQPTSLVSSFSSINSSAHRHSAPSGGGGGGEAVGIQLGTGDVVTASMVAKLISSQFLVGQPGTGNMAKSNIRPPSSSSTGIYDDNDYVTTPTVDDRRLSSTSSYKRVLVALEVNRCDDLRRKALNFLLQTANQSVQSSTLLASLAMINFEGIASAASMALAWGIVRKAGPALRRLRIVGGDGGQALSTHLTECTRVCTRLEDVELMITADFAMLAYSKLVASCGGTLKRVALVRGGRVVSSYSLQNALAQHCSQLRDVESIDFDIEGRSSMGIGLIEKLFKNNLHLAAIRVSYRQEWVPLLRGFAEPPSSSSTSKSMNSSSISSSPFTSRSSVSQLTSLTLFEHSSEIIPLTTTSTSDDEEEKEGGGNVTTDDHLHLSPLHPTTILNLNTGIRSRRRNAIPPLLTMFIPCIVSGNLTSLAITVSSIYQILPFPFVTDQGQYHYSHSQSSNCDHHHNDDSSTAGGSGGKVGNSSSSKSTQQRWTPLGKLTTFALHVPFIDASFVETRERIRVRSHARGDSGRKKRENRGGNDTNNSVPPSWSLPQIRDDDEDDGGSDVEDENTRSASLTAALGAREELAAVLLSISNTVEVLTLQNCAYFEVLSQGVSMCSRLTKLEISHQNESLPLLTDAMLAALLTSLSGGGGGKGEGRCLLHRHNPSPLTSLTLIGAVSPGDETIRALTESTNFPYLSNVALHAAFRGTSITLSEETLLRFVSDRPCGLVRQVFIEADEQGASDVQFTPAVARALVDSITEEDGILSGGGVGGNAGAVSFYVCALGDVAEDRWNEDSTTPTTASATDDITTTTTSPPHQILTPHQQTTVVDETSSSLPSHSNNNVSSTYQPSPLPTPSSSSTPDGTTGFGAPLITTVDKQGSYHGDDTTDPPLPPRQFSSPSQFANSAKHALETSAPFAVANIIVVRGGGGRIALSHKGHGAGGRCQVQVVLPVRQPPPHHN